MDRNQHLKRPVSCDDCGWIGINGELIAKDVLRCPKCDGNNIQYFVADAPAAIQ